MEILKSKFYAGRNIYCHRPVYYLEINLAEFSEKESREFDNFNEQLIEYLPNIIYHQCGIFEKNGFQQRLEEGTFFGHIIEHVSLEILHKLGYEVKYGKTRLLNPPNHYYLVFECPNCEVGERTAHVAVELIKSILTKKKYDLNRELDKLEKIKRTTELGPSTMAIYQAAKKRGIPVKHLDTSGSILQLGTGKHLKLVEATITSQTSSVGVDIACDKTMTKKILEKSGISVPIGRIAKTEEQALEIAKEIGTPVVVKPCDGNQGKGVTLNLETETEIRSAFKLAENYSNKIIVERHITGKHYRILVINDEVVAVSERLPAHIVGDGIHTIKELIDIENQNPLRGEDHDKPLTKIKVDPVVFMVLARKNMTINYIPKKQEKVFLRENANISTGGIAIDVTDQIHKDNIMISKRIAKVIGLDIAGIDLVTEDITKPVTLTGGAVIEVNAAPGIRMHLYPSVGKPRNVGDKIVNYLFPEDSPCQIPIIAITGTNGKTTTTRLISHILKENNMIVGKTSTDGIFIDDIKVMDGDNTGPISAQVILDDPTVEVAVLETARGGIVKRGLGYDLADVAVVTNLSEDHLGQDGINDIEELYHVKSLVAEAVKDKGFLVLNADDTYVSKMAKANPKAQVIFFSRDCKNHTIKRHLSLGGKAIYEKNNMIYLAEGDKVSPIVSLSKVPFTLNGAANHNVENTLASVGALLVFGLDKKIIKKGLQDFDSNIHNPGRANIFHENDVTVLLDYGHNKEGFIKTLDLAKSMKHNKLILVIGAPGDRLDKQLTELGEISAGYGDLLIVKEDKELRGRKKNEVAKLIYDGVVSAGMSKDKVMIINDENKAIGKAIEIAEPNDLVVAFYEKFDTIKEAALKGLAIKVKQIKKTG